MRRPSLPRGRPPATRPPQAGEITIAVDVSRRGLLPAADVRWLAGVARRAVTFIGRLPAEISIRILDDPGIAALHDRWLGVPGPTDVITFDLGTPGGPGLHGDIAVSVDTARRMAKEVGWDSRYELAYYAVHGLLHLAGEDDVAPDDRRRMRASERRLLVAVGLPGPPPRRPRRPRRRS